MWLNRAPLHDWIESQTGLPLQKAKCEPNTQVTLQRAANESVFAIGESGSGKSSVLRLLDAAHLKSGGSGLFIFLKRPDFTHCLAQVHAAGVPPERVTLLTPHLPGGMAAANPFAEALPLHETASDFAAAVLSIFGAGAKPRMEQILTSAAIAVAAHPGLSVLELLSLLSDPDYAAGLLARAPQGADPYTYSQARRFLTQEFATWSKSYRAEAVGSVFSRLDECLRNPYLRASLTARKGLRLSTLWKRQRVILLHLDPSRLGDAGARFLARLVVSGLFRTALRAKGPCKVVVSTDEGGVLLKELPADTYTSLLEAGRAQGVSMHLACQHAGQLPEALRASLLTNAGTLLLFRLGVEDARLLAHTLAAATEPRLTRAVLTLPSPRRGCIVTRTTWRYRIEDEYGRPLALERSAWERLRAKGLLAGGLAQVRELSALAAERGFKRLYVRAAGEVEALTNFCSTFPAESFWVEGPSLMLVVSFPRPNLSSVERCEDAESARVWLRVLTTLSRQHAVVRVVGKALGVVRVADCPAPSHGEGLKAYRRAVLRANGLSEENVTQVLEERLETVERLAGRGYLPPPGASAPPSRPAEPLEIAEVADGSLS